MDTLQEVAYDAPRLVKRHGTANVPFGWAALGISLCYLLYRELALYYYDKRWQRSGRSTTGLKWTLVPLKVFVPTALLLAVGLCFVKWDGDNIRVVIKRFGRVGYYLTPLDIFLSLRPCPFKLDNYLDTLALHKWFSRILLLLIVMHSIGYLTVWVVNDTFSKLFKPANFYGFLIFLAVCVLGVVNWRPIRHTIYKWFYLIHNVTVWLWILLTKIHARPGVDPAFYINLALMVYQLVVRFRSLQKIRLEDITEVAGSDLKIIRFSRQYLPDDALPGCHSRLSWTISDPRYFSFPSHPYTLAAIASRDMQVSAIVKESKYKFILGQEYSLQPFFQSSLNRNFFETAENINIVCGGSGVSYGIALFQFFKDKDVNLRFVWVTRHDADLFILRQFDIEGVQVWVTRSDLSASAAKEQAEPASADGASSLGGRSEDIELTSLDDSSHIDPFADPQETPQLEGKKTAIQYGSRPNLEQVLRRNLDATIDYANKWIISCGPESLMDECEQLARDHRCRFFKEEYAM